MSFTEVTHEGWFSRLGGAIKGVLAGLLLFIIGFPVLFWNEGRAVNREKTLNVGKTAVTIQADKVNPEFNDKLIHITGEATTKSKVEDNDFGVKAVALKIIRSVQMYQWVEEKKTKTRKKLGGGKERITTYDYRKEWSSKLHDSSEFKNRSDDYKNPRDMKYHDETFIAKNVTIGAFKLSDSLISKIKQYKEFTVSKAPSDFKGPIKVIGNGFYLGKNSSTPEIGDMKVTYQICEPQTVSIIAQQINDTFGAFVTSSGNLLELRQGTQSVAQMIAAAKEENNMMTWILRLVGFVLMFVGLCLVFKPFSVIGDVIPILGSLVSFGFGIIAFIVAACCSLVTIGIAWLFYRPLIGIPLLLLPVIVIVALFLMKKKKA